MAHLQCEGFQPDNSPQQPLQPPPGQRRGWRPPQAADLQQTLAFLDQLSSGALPALSQAAAAEHGNGRGKAAATRRHLRWAAGAGAGAGDVEEAVDAPPPPPTDLGVLLWGFFDRFGERRSGRTLLLCAQLEGRQVCIPCTTLSTDPAVFPVPCPTQATTFRMPSTRCRSAWAACA